ncbi:MAG: HEAT repeat domain-containing protein [Halobacteriovoraceae bacterium]|nr:HEAT repeat domain-containing protein [Halobacteriovoraceae bacterium]
MESTPETKKKKILENPIASGIVVPIAVVLIGALVVFGVTKLLTSERSYKDLVREMHTKTLGNRWVAAFELSKLISSSQIPEEDVPWLIRNLKEIYGEARDPRTRQFAVVAAGALQNETSAALLAEALSDEDPKVRFHTIVALGNMPHGFSFDGWEKVQSYLSSNDIGMIQAAALALSTHKVEAAEPELVGLLGHSNRVLRYTVASGLANFKNEKSLGLLSEILKLQPSQQGNSSLNEAQVNALKLSLLSSLERNKWNVLNKELSIVAKQDKSLKVASRAKEVLNSLKN